MIILISHPGSTEPRRLEIHKSEIVLGKRAECDVVLADPRVSRRHARIVAREGGLFVEDLGSTNGTWVGGRRVERPEILCADDSLEISDFTLRVQLTDEPPRSEVPAEPDCTVVLRGAPEKDEDVTPATPAPAETIVFSPPPATTPRPASNPESPRPIAARSAKGVRSELEVTIRRPDAGSADELREEEFVLICLSGTARGLRYPVSGDEVLVGSRSSCGIVVVGIEPVHVKLRRRADGWELHNLGSAGSVIHRGRHPKSTVLVARDVVKIGNVVFRLVREGEIFPPGYSEAELGPPARGGLLSMKALRDRRVWLALAVGALVLVSVLWLGIL
ncbi:MAG: FHA domain-containing protein [Candidatus Binatia bacterium]